MRKLALLQKLLEAEINLLGRTRIFHPTREAVQKKIDAFNQEHGTNFTLEEENSPTSEGVK